MHRTGVVVVLLTTSLLSQEPAEDSSPFRLDQVSSIPWRNIGPANMSGRVTDIEVVPGQASVWYVATAGGGLWKTDNAGTTWRTQFDHAPTVSLGDVAVAPSNPDVVWVGTGEENARNSVSWGDGVYKSTDGGDTFEHMGLAPTFQIGHIAIHPTNPDIVFVAALGRLWGHNPERGVYRTIDGGKTWTKALYLDDKTGCIDVRIDPHKPSVVYAAMFERLRDGFDSNDPIVRLGENAGLYRSDDGGDTWKKLYRGLPTCQWGRSGLSLGGKSGSTLFAIIETERSGWANGTEKDAAPTARPTTRSMGFSASTGERGVRLTRIHDGSVAEAAGFEAGDVVVKWGEAAVASSRELRAALRNGKAGEKVTVVVKRGDEEKTIAVELAVRSAPARGTAYMGVNGENGEDGAVLTTVTPGGPAADAGLEDGDLIVKIGDEQVSSWNDLRSVLGRASGGDKVAVTALRDGEEVAIDLTYGARPGAGGAGPGGGLGAGGSPNGPFGGRLNGQRADVQDQQGDKGFETGGIYRSDDRGDTWRRVNSLNDRPFYFSVIAADPQDDKTVYSCGINFYASHDGGKTFENAGSGTHADSHAIWVDPTNSDHVLLGCDGGVNVTWDRCKTWEVVGNLPIGQFYHAVADSSVPYRVYGGLQDNGTWGGPSRTRFREGATNDDWVQIYSGDGFRAHVDPTDPATVYATSQNGNVGRVDMRTGAQSRVQRPRGSQFNWNTPFFLSPHNPRLLFFAGNHAFRSLDRGARSEQMTENPLGLTEGGTATAMAESPRQPGLLYVGTDDGALWRSLDDGFTWEEIHAKVLGLAGPRYVSSIHPSQFETDRVYVTFDGHRSDDFGTHVYVSEDAGDTWTTLVANLADEPCHVVREDPTREDLLFLGTEFSCYVSLDRGQSWLNVGQGMPTVAVRDLDIQSRDSDLIAATHGRGIWILDIEPLRQLTTSVARADVHLFTPEDAILWRNKSRNLMGSREWRAPNPPDGAVIYALFDQEPKARPLFTIHDVTGKEIASVRGEARAGLQCLVWDARPNAPTREGAERGGGQRGGGRSRRSPPAPPGAYSVRLARDGDTLIEKFTLLPDPISAPAASASTSTSGN